MANTTNFGWETPDDTDLVKDGAAAMRTLGNSIDASFVDLKGGTTGQVLSKNSNTDLDFVWVAADDTNAIQNAIVDAKGDLISATAADTPARLAVGTDGQVLTADSTTSTGLKWVAPAAASLVGCSLYKSANQSINNNTYTALTWNSEDYDTDAFHDNSTNTSRITIPSGKGGKYLITGIVIFQDNATNDRTVYLYKNGVEDFEMFSMKNAGGFNTSSPMSIIKVLSAGDYIELFALQNSGGSLNIIGGALRSHFQVYYLGA